MVKKMRNKLIFTIILFLLAEAFVNGYLLISHELVITIAFLIILFFLKKTLTPTMGELFDNKRNETRISFEAAFIATIAKYVVPFNWVRKDEQIVSIRNEKGSLFVGVSSIENIQIILDKTLNKNLEENLSLIRKGE